jgi:hypothetical protein
MPLSSSKPARKLFGIQDGVAVGVVYAQEIRLNASMPVDVSMVADIQQSYVLIVVPFCEDDPQIMVGLCSPFSAHLAG